MIGRAAALPLVTPALRPILAADDVGAALEAWPVATRRELVEVVLGGVVRVCPTGRGRSFNPEAVVFPWDIADSKVMRGE